MHVRITTAKPYRLWYGLGEVGNLPTEEPNHNLGENHEESSIRAMTVEELITELQKIEDKTLICKVYDADMGTHYPVNYADDIDDYVAIG